MKKTAAETKPQTPQWTEELKRLALAAALRGDFLSRTSLDADLFGSANERGPRTPRQRIAAAVVSHFAQYKSVTVEIVEGAVRQEADSLGPEERGELLAEWDAVAAAQVPADLQALVDAVNTQAEGRRIEVAILQAADLRGAGDTEGARNVLAEALRPRAGGDRLALVRGSDITMRNVPWTWFKRVPRGALTLVVGDPDVNKTTVCLDYAARVSRGRPFPDGAPGSGRPEAVIFLSAEDSPEYTLMPRFVALGGDPDRIFFQKSEVGQAALSIKDDIARLEASVERTGARHVVIDPMNAYLANVDTWKDNEIRGALAPLAAMAERTGTTVLGIMHLNKKNDYSALQRVMGSTGYVAMARAVYLVVKDQSNPSRRLFLNSKMNVGAKPSGMAFTLVPATAGRDPDGQPITTLKIAWEGTVVTVTADEFLQSAGKPARPGERARAFLLDLLKDGPVLSDELNAAIAQEPDVASERTFEGVLSKGFPTYTGGGRRFRARPGVTKPQFDAWFAGREG